MVLLGEQLIRDAKIAVFELVKNAYDADASSCKVILSNIDTPNASIVIEDDGVGMTPEIVSGVWLEPGTDYRQKQKKQRNWRTSKGRLPLGEKGIGRFAVHKLGEKIKMVTRAAGDSEVVVEIDWEKDFKDKVYLSEASINVSLRSPLHFTGEKTGTRIEVSKLREKWTRGKVRDLYRSVNSICSPFNPVSPNNTEAFDARLILIPDPDPRKSWLSGLLDIKNVLELSLFRGCGIIEGHYVIYDYEFKPLSRMESKIEGRTLKDVKEPIFGVLPEEEENISPRKRPKPRPIDLDKVYRNNEPDNEKLGIGPVHFDFYIFDREPMVLELTTSDNAGLKRFLDISGGVRVFRDSVRVYDFGELGNDWLDLGGRRVNIPVRRISNNQIIAAISLDSERSTGLIEKTNREGFIENEAYDALKVAVLFAIRQIEVERNLDKERLRKVYSRKRIKEPVVEEIAVLRRKLKKRKLLEEFEPIVDRIENQFIEARERLLSPAAAGLNLSVVIHELEKIVDEIVKAVEMDADKETLSKLIKNLDKTIDGITFLLKTSGKKQETASILIKQALFNYGYRFRAHNIRITNGMEGKEGEYSLNCYRRLIVATLMNFMDNSIYWLATKGNPDRQIYIGITEDLEGGPAFVVADNGPGFRETDPPEYLVQPFISRKDDGMGLGLHIANEVAKLHNGHLLFPEIEDINVPPEFTGAVVALQIPMQRSKFNEHDRQLS